MRLMLFCKDCRFMRRTMLAGHPECAHPNARVPERIDLVMGGTKPAYQNRCAEMRRSEITCGESAQWFEQKEVGP